MAATLTLLETYTHDTALTSHVGDTILTASVNDWIVVTVAAPNNGTSGAVSLTGFTDSAGNTYTQRARINYTTGSVASDGTTLGIYTAPVTSALSGSGNVTGAFSPSTGAVAWHVYRVQPGAGETISFIAADATGTTGTGTSHAAATVSVTSGDIIFAASALESIATITGDSDTTNGSWSAIQTGWVDVPKNTSISEQHKTVTATGNQSWACTTAASTDSAQSYLVLRSVSTIAAITDLANATSITNNTTLVTGATVTATVTDNDFLVVLVAAANSGTSGAASLTTVADSGATNVYTQRALINYTPTATASDGATLGIYTCPITAAITSGTITATFSANCPEKSIEVYRVRPLSGQVISFISADTTGSTGAVTSHAAATVSVTSGDIIFGAASIETDDAITGDSDTTNGSWSTIITRLADNGTDPTTQSCSSQYKTVTATGNQSWACTTASARDSARSYLILRMATSGKTLTADVGSYSLVGTDAALRRALPMVADPGSYAQTGTDATLRRNLPMVAGLGAYALTGTDASPLHSWKTDLTVASSYTLTGSDANISHGFFIAADPGSYSLAGTDANLRRNLPLVADPGSYSLLGTDATTLHQLKLDATIAGSYSLTGIDVALITAANKQISANAGSYDLTGSDVTLTLFSNNKTIVADAGSYALTGTDATTTHAWKLDATTAATYGLVGSTASVLLGHKLDATVAAAYALTGSDATTTHLLELDATVGGSYTLTGTDAFLDHGFELDATAGSYALLGDDADLLLLASGAQALAASPGNYLLVGSDVTLVYQPIEVIVEVSTRGEWPEKGRKERRRKRPEVTAREDLRVALDRLYDGGEYDAPAEVLEEAATKARAVVNVLTKLPNIPLVEVRAAEDLIRSIQEMLRQRVLEEERALNDVAMQIAHQHLIDTIIIADEVYRRTRQNYLIKTLLLIAE